MSETAVEDLLRQLAPQVLGAVVRRYGHFDIAEDAVQDAMLAAATQWPNEGLPDNPKGWLIRVAARRLTDLLRSEQARRRREDTVARWDLPVQQTGTVERAADTDDTLILLFMCCHPVLSPTSQIALTLRAVGGLSTAEDHRLYAVRAHLLEMSGETAAACEAYRAAARRASNLPQQRYLNARAERLI
jgi:predicted RNA polymerase sigma factor